MIESLSTILPTAVVKPIAERLNYERLTEIRLRAARPVVVGYGATLYFLTPKGLSTYPDDALVCSNDTVREVVLRATEFSLYAVNDQLRQGFLTIRGGVRIGVAGEVVAGQNGVKTLKNFSSVNIRIPHEILGASELVYRHCCTPTLHNTLIISPPGAGKTTVLRDLARQIGCHAPLNLLVVDERNELAASHNGIAQLDVGSRTDIIANSDKAYAFNAAIRALAPDVILTDELSGELDAAAVTAAAGCGVRVIASCHAQNHGDILQKPGFATLYQNRIFTRYCDLSKRSAPGFVDGIYDADGNVVYAP